MNSEAWSVTKWRERVAGVPGKLWEVDAGLPVRMYYGSNDRGHYSFGFITDVEPSSPTFSNSISTSIGRRAVDGRWTLTFILEQQDLSSVFTQFCSHMYSRVSSSTSVHQALGTIDETIGEWVRLFRNFRGDRLGIKEMRGLFAELHFGFCSLDTQLPADLVVSSWDGPFGFDQDFNFNSSSCEVKSRKPGSKSVLISSQYQLTGSNVYLAVLTVSDYVTPAEGAVTLPRLVETILNKLASESRYRFEMALLELGFQYEDSYYENYYFSVGELRIYQVRDSFPHISAETLPDGVDHVRYSLRIDALAAFRCDLSELPVSDEYSQIGEQK